VPIVMPLIAVAQPRPFFSHPQAHSSAWQHDPTTLLDKVRRATGRFKDINVAMAEGWVQGSPA
jgi:hypothetical protein